MGLMKEDCKVIIRPFVCSEATRLMHYRNEQDQRPRGRNTEASVAGAKQLFVA